MTAPRRSSARASGRAEAAGPPVPAGLAPAMVQVRLTGSPADNDRAAALIAAHPAITVVRYSPGHANRRDPGERAYLTITIAQEDTQP